MYITNDIVVLLWIPCVKQGWHWYNVNYEKIDIWLTYKKMQMNMRRIVHTHWHKNSTKETCMPMSQEKEVAHSVCRCVESLKMTILHLSRVKVWHQLVPLLFVWPWHSHAHLWWHLDAQLNVPQMQIQLNAINNKLTR